MHARMVKLKIGAGRADQAISIFIELMLPEMKQQPGFKDGFLLIDRPNNNVLGFSLWEDNAEMTATKQFLHETYSILAAVWAAPPDAEEVYEIGELSQLIKELEAQIRASRGDATGQTSE